MKSDMPQNKKRRLLIDMDGVVADFEGHALQIYQQERPQFKFIPLEKRKGFYIDHQYKCEVGPVEGAFMRSIFDRPHFFRTIPVIEPAVQQIKQLMHENKHEIFFLTSPMVSNPTCASDKLKWIAEVFGNKWARRTIITCDKTVVHGDWLIDDKPVIRGIQAPKWQHILCRAYNNRMCTTETHPLILESWSDLSTILSSSKAEKKQRKKRFFKK